MEVGNHDVGKATYSLTHSVMLKLDPTTGSGESNHFDIRFNCLVATMTKTVLERK